MNLNMKSGSGEEEEDSATAYVSFEKVASLVERISPKKLDSVLAGLGLALSACALRMVDSALGHYDVLPFFAVPSLSSGLLFFAGPVPPPGRAFILCTIKAWACAYLIFLLPITDAAFKASLTAGALLTLFKLSNHFFVPTVGLAAVLLTDPTGKLLSSPLIGLKFLAAPWLLCHGLLFAAAHVVAIGRRRVRVELSRSRFKRSFAALSNDALREVFERYDTSADGFLQAGELKYAWWAVTGEEMSEADADALVKSIDTDGNGEIDVEEFIALVHDARNN